MSETHPQIAKATCILGEERTAAIVADAERDGRDPVSAVKFAMHAHAVDGHPGFSLRAAVIDFKTSQAPGKTFDRIDFDRIDFDPCPREQES